MYETDGWFSLDAKDGPYMWHKLRLVFVYHCLILHIKDNFKLPGLFKDHKFINFFNYVLGVIVDSIKVSSKKLSIDHTKWTLSADWIAASKFTSLYENTSPCKYATHKKMDCWCSSSWHRDIIFLSILASELRIWLGDIIMSSSCNIRSITVVVKHYFYCNEWYSLFKMLFIFQILVIISSKRNAGQILDIQVLFAYITSKVPNILKL